MSTEGAEGSCADTSGGDNPTVRDIRYQFWAHIGYEVKDGQLFTATAETFGYELETLYTETLLPSNCTAGLLTKLKGGESGRIGRNAPGPRQNSTHWKPQALGSSTGLGHRVKKYLRYYGKGLGTYYKSLTYYHTQERPMEIWPKNDDAPRVLFLDDEVSTEGTVRITIEDDSDNVSETVLIDREEAIEIINHLKRVFSIT